MRDSSRVSVELSASSHHTTEQKRDMITHTKRLLKQHDAVIVAHYYVDAQLQQLAEQTGGMVADSLKMAQFGYQHPAQTLIVVGVRFMGETAKILSPHKRVVMPALEATCSLDIGCPADEFATFCNQHPDRTVVVYANTSAAVKARSDWVVTSSVALPIVQHLHALDQKLLWAPDRYLGQYVVQKTQADMVIWQGSCVVHEAFKRQGIIQLKERYPDAAVLVHPESPLDVIELADVVGSTSRLIQAARECPHRYCIVATDVGIFYKMQQVAPDKIFLEAPSGGHGATCRSCAHCPWMAMNQWNDLQAALENKAHEIKLEKDLIAKARVPIQRMLDFAERGV